jgi:hypothetical protein
MTPITRAAILALSTVGLFAIQAFPYDRVRAQEIPKQEMVGAKTIGNAATSTHATCEWSEAGTKCKRAAMK